MPGRSQTSRSADHGSQVYVFGLAKNQRLIRKVAREMKRARRRYGRTERAARFFRAFSYRTRQSWSRARHVVGKAEFLQKGANPRFVVTSLATTPPQALYEDIYCARGEMENRIKEQQLDLFADRTSAASMRSNQLRLYFSSFAYVLLHYLRRVGLRGTELAHAQCGTIRLKLLKIGALVAVSVRRIRFRMASGYPHANLFWQVLTHLRHGVSAGGSQEPRKHKHSDLFRAHRGQLCPFSWHTFELAHSLSFGT